jgi:hypothetical protein
MSQLQLNLPDDKALARKVLDADSEHKSARLQQGWLGCFFGDQANKPGNIAGLVIILSMLAMLASVLLPIAADVSRRELLVLFGGLATSALGFVFGRASVGS